MKKSSTGFTLLELAFVLIIIAFLGAFAGPIFHTIGEIIITEYATNDLNTQGRIAIERMARETRLIRSPNDLTHTSSSISFIDVDGTAIAYSKSGTNLMRNSQILSGNISALNFTYYDSTGEATTTTANIRYIKIAITLTQNTVSTTLDTTVYPRALS